MRRACLPCEAPNRYDYPKSDYTICIKMLGVPALFQSAPLTKARGDSLTLARASDYFTFQSAPLTKARGDIMELLVLAALVMFQSAPLTKARGDSRSSLASSPVKLFQSAPLTKARGDPEDVRDEAVIRVFQSAPLTKARGDGLVQGEASLYSGVSIRSPHQSKGRRALDSPSYSR